MKNLKTTNGHIILVDDDIFTMVRNFKWYMHNYPQRVSLVDGKKTCVLLHRVIMNAPKGVEVDHIDGNPLNNQKSNLRLCTHADNQRNRVHLGKNNTSGAKGVSLRKSDNTWYAMVKVNGKNKNVGSGFRTIEEAIAARDKFAKKFHGEFYAPSVPVYKP